MGIVAPFFCGQGVAALKRLRVRFLSVSQPNARGNVERFQVETWTREEGLAFRFFFVFFCSANLLFMGGVEGVDTKTIDLLSVGVGVLGREEPGPGHIADAAAPASIPAAAVVAGPHVRYSRP